jgi:chaperonin GroEL
MATPKRIVVYGDKARNQLIEGAKFLKECLAITIGPFGQNWFLEKQDRITNDGVTIARELEHPHEIKNRGLKALREACIKVVDEVGDGTTSVAVLCFAIMEQAVRQLGDLEKQVMRKMAPIEVVKKIEEETLEVVKKLNKMAVKIKSKEELIKSAKVSVEDDELADLIGSMQYDLGPDGIILAEETAEQKCSIEKVKGIRIDNGFGTGLVMNDLEKQVMIVEETAVVLTNYTLQDLKPLIRVIQQLEQAGVVKNLVIVARAFSSNAIQICMKNIANAALKTYPVNAPYVDQTEIMKDMAAVLGGVFIHDEERALEDTQLSDIGFAKKVMARRWDAIFTGKDDKTTLERVDKRVKELKDAYKGSNSEFEKKNLKTRIAQLEDGFAILKVGAQSDTLRKYKKDKADDAVNAVRVALQEGVVPGAGLAFKMISDDLPDDYLLKKPLLSIYEQIKASAPKGWKPEAWVKDPVKVLRVVLERASAVGSAFATAGGATAMEKDKPMFVRQADNAADDNGDE